MMRLVRNGRKNALGWRLNGRSVLIRENVMKYL